MTIVMWIRVHPYKATHWKSEKHCLLHCIYGFTYGFLSLLCQSCFKTLVTQGWFY